MDFKKILPKTIKRNIIIFAGLFFVTVIIASFIIKKTADETGLPLATAALKPFKVSVNAVGQLDSVNAITVSSELKGEVKIVYLVEEGIKVKKGDILVRFDSRSLTDKVSTLSAKVEEWKTVVNAHQQLLEFEKNQAVREIKAAEFDLKVAGLELQKIEQGDGPLELSRLEGELLEKKTQYEELKGYIKDLHDLEKKGYSYPVEISQARKKMERLGKEFDVTKQKYEAYKDFFLPTSIETAKSKVERAKMIVTQTHKGVGFKIGKATAEYRKAKQELEKYKRELKQVNLALEKTMVRSPQEGLVVMKERIQDGEYRKPRVGDLVFWNQPILFLPDISAMMVKVLIREVDLNKVKIGKKVNIKVDAYPDIKLTGRVSFIGALAEQRQEIRAGSEKYFKVNILVSEKEESLRPGMTARIEIIVKEGKRDALIIPINAVFEEDGNHFVYVAARTSEMTYQKRIVKIGMQNLESVEILEGIKAGENVCLAKPPGSKITN